MLFLVIKENKINKFDFHGLDYGFKGFDAFFLQNIVEYFSL